MTNKTHPPAIIRLGNDTYISEDVPKFEVSEITLKFISTINIYTDHSLAQGMCATVGLLFSSRADSRLQSIKDEPYWAAAYKEFVEIRKATEKLRHRPLERICLVLRGTKQMKNEEDSFKDSNEDDKFEKLNKEFTEEHEKAHALSLKWFKHDSMDPVTRAQKGPASRIIHELCDPFVSDYEKIFYKAHHSGGKNSTCEFIADFYAVEIFASGSKDQKWYITESIKRGYSYHEPCFDAFKAGVTFFKIKSVVEKTLKEQGYKIPDPHQTVKPQGHKKRKTDDADKSKRTHKRQVFKQRNRPD